MTSSGALQLALGPYLWSVFEIADGKVSAAAVSVVSFREVRRSGVQKLGALWYREIEIEVSDVTPSGRRTEDNVRIDTQYLMGDSGEVRMQPAQAALLEGARLSGLDAGMIRVVSVRRSGRSFVARVEVVARG